MLDAYPLSPLQQGMLFHHVASPASGVDVEQLVVTLPEAVQAERLLGAWQEVAQRHEVLRTSFRWLDVAAPEQVVHPSVALSLDVLDWRGMSPHELDAMRSAFLDRDRRRGFSIDRAPLMRFALIRTGESLYELVWSFHHIILDGRSFPMLLREAFARYDGADADAISREETRPYRELIAWLQLRNPERSADFWHDRLQGIVAPTPLPTAFTQAPTNSGQHGGRECRLTPTVTARIAHVAAMVDATANTLVQAAWGIVLARHSGETDVVFGATRAARHDTVSGAERMIGLFINTVPVRISVDETAPLGPWLTALRRSWREIHPHEHTPLAMIHGWSDVPQGAPLFETLVVFEEYGLEDRLRGFGGAWANRRIQLHEQTNFAMTVAAYGGDVMTLKLGYDRARIDDRTAERILEQLATTLESLANADISAPISAVAWLPPHEITRIVTVLDHTGEPEARGDARTLTIDRLFCNTVAAFPDAVAVALDGEAITYADLNAKANRIAHYLARRGCRPGMFVGVAMRPSIELIAAILAVIKVGAGYLPLDPTWPTARLRFILGDAGAAIVLADRDSATTLRGISEAVPVALVDIHAALAAESADDPASRARSEDPAYLMYTSGSTGEPKGVVVPHRAVVRLVHHNNFMQLASDDVFLMLAPISFDASTLELWAPLLNGARLAIPAPGTNALERLGELVRRHGVTTIWLTAALFRHVVDNDIDALRPLRQLLAGGDVLPREQVRRMKAELPAVQLINGYGPTENTTFTCCHHVTAADMAARSIPIGRPIAGTRVYVLDASMRPVPIGVPGELWTGGAGVALEYLNQPALTVERFVDSPFCPGDRLYRTGDRVLWRPDGAIEFLGRADGQVKLRGFRVEPGEVEAVLGAHPAVSAAAVVVRTGRRGGTQLVAYYTIRASVNAPAVPDHAALRDFLALTLPAHMLPSVMVRLDGMPVTENGKVDRKALPPADEVERDERSAYAAPRSATEASLARVWSDVLGVRRLGIHDNYYELGGDSILSIQIASRARAAGLNVGAAMVNRHPTVAALAAALASEAPSADAPTECAVPVGPAPLTPIQHWFFELDPAEPNHWNQAFLLRTETDLDRAALRGAVDAVLRHHDALRSRFEFRDGAWSQHSAPEPDTDGTWIEDLTARPDSDIAPAVAEIAARAARSLDFVRGPCIRVVFMRLGHERGHRLLIVAHHLVIDGVSWRILFEDLEAAFTQLAAGAPVHLPATGTSYAHWAAGLTTGSSTAAPTNERAYWLGQSSAPLLTLPVDGSHRTANIVGDAATVVVSLDPTETAELLQRVPAAYATQANDVLILALAEALAPWVGSGRLLVDFEGHGREDVVAGADLTRTIGWFTSVFPLALPLGEAGPLGDRLKRMKELLRAVPRRGIGYGCLRYLAGDPDLAQQPAADVVFNYLGQFDALLGASSLFSFAPEDAGAWLGPMGRRRHLLDVNAIVLHGQLEIRWTFARHIHDDATVRRVADRMVGALRSIIEHCRQPGAGGRTPSDFDLISLSQEQVDRLAGDGSDVADILPLAPMQELFVATGAPGADVGFEQWRFDIDGPLDGAALQRAWEFVATRHDIFGASFATEQLATPVQLMHRRSALPFVTLDWRGLDTTTFERRIVEFRANDQTAGFDVAQAPLVRLTLIRATERSWVLVWSNHHLLFDRWSWPIVLREVGMAYEAFHARREPTLSPTTPWRRYLEWLTTRDDAAAEAFWRAELSGVRPVPLGPWANAGAHGGERLLEMSGAETDALAALARTHRVSLNTVIMAAWGLWLAGATASDDVTFGRAVAGRPDEVPGIEQLVGMCINNVPLRLRIDPAASLHDLLVQVQERQRAAEPHAHVRLTNVQRWSGLPWHARVFDTLLVFQHHGADDDTTAWLGADVAVRMAPVTTQTNYPLALLVSGKEQLALRIAFQGRTAGSADADRVLVELHAVLLNLTNRDDAPIGTARDLVPEQRTSGRGLAAGCMDGNVSAPETATEWVVERIWAEVLGRDTVGIDANFFDLGGQSLVATQIVSRVRDQLQTDLPVSLLFEHPTVRRFAVAVIARESAPGRVDHIATIVQRVDSMSPEQLRDVAIHG